MPAERCKVTKNLGVIHNEDVIFHVLIEWVQADVFTHSIRANV